MFEIIQNAKMIPTKPSMLWDWYTHKNIAEIIIVEMILGKVFLIIFTVFTLSHENIGTIPMTRIAGTIMGIVVELKYGSPTEILLLEKISTSKGYTVPKNTEAHTIIMSVLFSKIEPSLLKKEK